MTKVTVIETDRLNKPYSQSRRIAHNLGHYKEGEWTVLVNPARIAGREQHLEKLVAKLEAVSAPNYTPKPNTYVPRWERVSRICFVRA